EDIKLKIKSGNPITRLIIINVAVFLIISILRILLFLTGGSISTFVNFIIDNISLPLSLQGIIHKPWTLITYMFTHIEIFHILWNLITLYWFGQILSDYTSPKKIIPLYLMGGVAGALITILLFSVVPVFQPYLDSPMVGASAGITAIIIAAATLVPNYRINLMFVGAIKLIYVALFVLFIDILSVASYNNIGGNIAHLGGALMGYVFILQYKKGRDWTLWINRFMDWIKNLLKKSPKSKMKVAYKRGVSDEAYNYNKKVTQEQIDIILDKISRSGYESLSKAEKEILFKASNK
ncbi:MAG: rhomboid family intramembrane serine protease, partial [Bacteroidota bacterium]|nr:rhomboid family intramembrane serine protease [Bacteroidota bacterium]